MPRMRGTHKNEKWPWAGRVEIWWTPRPLAQYLVEPICFSQEEITDVQ